MSLSAFVIVAFIFTFTGSVLVVEPVVVTLAAGGSVVYLLLRDKLKGAGANLSLPLSKTKTTFVVPTWVISLTVTCDLSLNIVLSFWEAKTKIL